MITLPEIKEQLRLEQDDTTEDAHLQLLGRAAVAAVANELNRNLYEEQIPEDDDTGLIITDNIRMAMLLMVGQLYEHRETTISGTIISEVPLAYSYLLSSYRIYNV